MINLCFFAKLREQLQCAQLQWQITSPITVQALKQQLVAQGGKWSVLNEGDVLCAINHEISSADAIINDNDEVAFFPPVTGG